MIECPNCKKAVEYPDSDFFCCFDCRVNGYKRLGYEQSVVVLLEPNVKRNYDKEKTCLLCGNRLKFNNLLYCNKCYDRAMRFDSFPTILKRKTRDKDLEIYLFPNRF